MNEESGMCWSVHLMNCSFCLSYWRHWKMSQVPERNRCRRPTNRWLHPLTASTASSQTVSLGSHHCTVTGTDQLRHPRINMLAEGSVTPAAQRGREWMKGKQELTESLSKCVEVLQPVDSHRCYWSTPVKCFVHVIWLRLTPLNVRKTYFKYSLVHIHETSKYSE